jgi:hypothetical protein
VKGFSSQKSIQTICRSLRNRQLELLTLISSDEIFGIAQSASATASSTDVDVNCCASKFYSYSTSDILVLSIDTLDAILSNTSLRIIDEDWLLDLLIEVGTDASFLFDHLRLEYLSSEGISRFCDLTDYIHFTENIWIHLLYRLKGICDTDGRKRRFFDQTPSGFESTIISNFHDVFHEFRNRQLKLLYRGSRDGFRSSNFHEKCDGQSDTITLIRTTKDFIFGGYTPLSWDSMDKYKADSSHRSFVFTITDSHNLISRKFGLKPDYSQYAILGNSSYGPIFGDGHPICVCDNCSTCNNNYTKIQN